jgi:Ca2+-transporting ATPase
MIAWHTREIANITKALNTHLEQGLSEGQVPQLHKKFGKNILTEKAKFTTIAAIFKQLFGPLSMILIIAFVVTLALAEYTDAVVIFAALSINVVIGVLQEGKAAKVFESLARSVYTNATVIRGGVKQVIDSIELVPGDVVILEGGHKVPADVRLVEANDLHVNESALTGEWIATSKSVDVLQDQETPLSGQANMAFMGTVVAEGYGKGIVVATGGDAAFGTLAQSTVGSTNTETPLSKSINSLAHTIVGMIGIAIAIIFVIGILRGGSIAEMLFLSVAIAVAAMPGGLPAAVSVTLAFAMEAILRKGGLVKNLLSAETLGTATVILTDKTGTLTHGVMKLVGVHSAEHLTAALPKESEGDDYAILKMAVLASDAFIEGVDEQGNPKVHGRPLEKAIVEGSLAAGLRQDELFKSGNSRQEFLQFEASRRYAVSLNTFGGKSRMYITGSPEHILSHATQYLKDGKREPLTQEVRDAFKEVQDRLSAEGKRFTAVAYRESSESAIPNDIRSPEEGEQLGFVFGGLLSFSDSVRDDVPEAIATAKSAGVQVIMVTGDHGETAKSVATEVGLNASNVILGTDFAKLADEALVLAVKNGNIFARMLPEQKLRLATVLQEAGEVVAMTGDGVNDAPVLIAANIGIAQGSGTDVAKDASDMILTNGSFSVIIVAIREGRRALANLQKIIVYLLSTSASEIVLIGGSVIAGLPLPLLPAQILWANIVEEGFMSFPFAFEPSEKDSMKRPPIPAGTSNSLFAGGFQKLIIFISFAAGAILFLLYILLNYIGVEIDELRTIMFVAVSLDSILLAFSFKNLHQPIWHTSLFSNRYLLGGMVISLTLLGISLTWAPLMKLLSLTPLNLFDIFFLTLLGIVNIMVVEFAKYLFTKDR